MEHARGIDASKRFAQLEPIVTFKQTEHAATILERIVVTTWADPELLVKTVSDVCAFLGQLETMFVSDVLGFVRSEAEAIVECMQKSTKIYDGFARNVASQRPGQKEISLECREFAEDAAVLQKAVFETDVNLIADEIKLHDSTVQTVVTFVNNVSGCLSPMSR